VESLARWEPFADVNPALRRLATRHRLAIISNVDRNLLGGSIRHFPVRFDALITAEDARAYKPNPAVFRLAIEKMGCPANEIAHVAFGAEYDLRPAHDLGMRVIYLNRSGLPSPDVKLEAEIRSLEELPALWD
jgi:2-haloacid dehalogenase